MTQLTGKVLELLDPFELLPLTCDKDGQGAKCGRRAILRLHRRQGRAGQGRAGRIPMVAAGLWATFAHVHAGSGGEIID